MTTLSSNIINNGRYLGLAMRLTEYDVLCCPAPLFHAFGLVIGFLTSFIHGSKVIFPAPTFDAGAAVDALIREKTTALLGVPSMLLAMLEELKKTPRPAVETVRTGITGGSAVSPVLIRRLQHEMGLPHMLSAYGMTETGPVTFITSIEDTRNSILGTAGQVLPHVAAKVVDGEDNIVPCGTRGHICTSGYGLQQGYWRDEAQTAHAMRPDADGVVWMYTGDEGFLDRDGYMHITGRIKDIIIRGESSFFFFFLLPHQLPVCLRNEEPGIWIRPVVLLTRAEGGENISPIEIEDRLLEHPSVTECCVVGLEDPLYGEVVSCFLVASVGSAPRPSDQELADWVAAEMDHTRAPRHVFWLGESDIGEELPKTGSGKYQKHLIRAIGNALVKSRRVRPKL
jgi:mevalonyl-CoA ligase